MLRIEINREKCKTEIGGTLINLLTETIIAINCIHRNIEEIDSDASEVFKDIIIKNIEMAFLDDDEIAKEVEPKKDALIKALKSFLNDLEEE